MEDESEAIPGAGDEQPAGSDAIAQPETLNLNPETKEMEVHHHPHVEKKNFKEYLLEGLMIFVAVTMGFFAESLREKIAAKEQEHQYMESLYYDLSSDEKGLPFLADWMNGQVGEATLLQAQLKNITADKNADSIYVNLRLLIRQVGISFFITDRTITQLRNAGGMRLLHNKQIADSILTYYKDIELFEILQNATLNQKGLLRNAYTPILDGYEYDKIVNSDDHVSYPTSALHLRSADPIAINNCLLVISDIKSLQSSLVRTCRDIINEAGRLKKAIAVAYSLKDGE